MVQWVKKGITKLGVLTLVAAVAVVMATVVFLLRLGEALPNVMFSHTEPLLDTSADINTAERLLVVDKTAQCATVDNGAFSLRAFLQSKQGNDIRDTRQTGFAAYLAVPAPTTPVLPFLVKLTQ